MSKNMNKDMNGKALGKARAAGRVATVAAATIAMTGGSLLSPLTAAAQGADGIGAAGATGCGWHWRRGRNGCGDVAADERCGRRYWRGCRVCSAKVADLQAAVDAARAKAATAKADLEAAAAPYDAAAVNQQQARGAYDAARGASDSAPPLLRPSWKSSWALHRTRPIRMSRRLRTLRLRSMLPRRSWRTRMKP